MKGLAHETMKLNQTKVWTLLFHMHDQKLTLFVEEDSPINSYCAIVIINNVAIQRLMHIT